MRIFADLHIHSKYSRATSKNLDLANLEKYAKVKGINLMGTGDFQHPIWNKELKKDLVEDGTGILKSKSGFNFMLTSEVSLIYSQDGKGRRNHLVLFAPSLEIVDQIQAFLLSKGRIDYDGRPIFKIPSNEFVYHMKKISNDIEIIPAHIWTPHFSLFGDYNQFNTVEECFKDQTKHIHAMETGLSSDPPMNWRLSQLDKYNLVSFSDSHSFWPWKLGREATIFDLNKLTYKDIINAVRSGDGLHGTVEVEPNFGKYHFTGHRSCDLCLDPKDAKSLHYICPKCHGKMPVGVADRIEVLADREEGYVKKNAKKFYTLIPLSELIAVHYDMGIATQKTWQIFQKLVTKERNEFDILLNIPEEKLLELADRKFVDVILKNRAGEIKVQPGYDGVYGIPLLKGEGTKTYHPTANEITDSLSHAKTVPYDASSKSKKDDDDCEDSFSDGREEHKEKQFSLSQFK